MSRFACGHCGTEVIAERRGGAVMLKSVAEAIRKVQVGTDKTAAELSIVRLTQELAEKRAALVVIEAENTGRMPGLFALLAWATSTMVMVAIAGALPTT